MARHHVPYARAGKRVVLASALTALSVAAAASVGLPAFGAHSSGGGADTGVAAARLRVRQIEQQLVGVQSAAQQRVGDYASANARVAALQRALITNRRDLARTKTAIKISETALALRIVSLYTDPPPTLVQVLVSTGSISSALDSYDLLRHIANQDSDLLRRFQADHARLQNLSTSLRKDTSDAEANRAKVANQLAQLRSLAGQRSALLASATTDLSHVQASASQLAALRAARARAAAAAAPHSTPTQAVGGASGGSGASAGSGGSTGGSSGHSSGGGSGVPGGSLYAILTRIAMCESGGNPHEISPGGMYRGLFQFSMATWAGVGGQGDPAQASVAEQYRRAAILYERSGPSQWPVCGAR